jgi:hypothetical protein
MAKPFFGRQPGFSPKNQAPGETNNEKQRKNEQDKQTRFQRW